MFVDKQTLLHLAELVTPIYIPISRKTTKTTGPKQQSKKVDQKAAVITSEECNCYWKKQPWERQEKINKNERRWRKSAKGIIFKQRKKEKPEIEERKKEMHLTVRKRMTFLFLKMIEMVWSQIILVDAILEVLERGQIRWRVWRNN